MADETWLEKMQMMQKITDTICKHPDWGYDVVAAVFHGAAKAMSREVEMRAKADLACRTAMSLLSVDRLAPGTKDVLNRTLIKYLESLGENQLSITETKTLEKLRGETSE